MFILLQHFCFIRFHIKLSLISVDDPGRSPKVAVETTRVFVWVYVIYIYIHIMFVYIYILYMCIKIDNTFIYYIYICIINIVYFLHTHIYIYTVYTYIHSVCIYIYIFNLFMGVFNQQAKLAGSTLLHKFNP